jgi:hypothetical protein
MCPDVCGSAINPAVESHCGMRNESMKCEADVYWYILEEGAAGMVVAALAF